MATEVSCKHIGYFVESRIGSTRIMAVYGQWNGAAHTKADPCMCLAGCSLHRTLSAAKREAIMCVEWDTSGGSQRGRTWAKQAIRACTKADTQDGGYSVDH